MDSRECTELKWSAPPTGSPADRVLDNLGLFRRPSWERACRWCRGWNVTDTKRLAEEAARGGDPRLAWFVPVLEAQDRLLAEKSSSASDGEVRDVIRRGRPYSDRGWRAYRLKARGRRTWASIARARSVGRAQGRRCVADGEAPCAARSVAVATVKTRPGATRTMKPLIVVARGKLPEIGDAD